MVKANNALSNSTLLKCQWVGILLKFLARLFGPALTLMHAGVSNLECKKRVGRQHTTFTSCQNAACSNEYFLFRVDYALEGSTFWLSNLCSACFMLRGRDTHIHLIFCGYRFWSARYDWWFSLWCKSISFYLFWNVKFFIAAKQRFQVVLIFPKVPPWSE